VEYDERKIANIHEICGMKLRISEPAKFDFVWPNLFKAKNLSIFAYKIVFNSMAPMQKWPNITLGQSSTRLHVFCLIKEY
jgi:hypothetical protein